LIQNVPNEKQILFDLEEHSFESVFFMTGGRMSEIQSFVMQVIEGGNISSVERSQAFQNAYFNRLQILQEDLPKQFTPSDLLEVMELLTMADGCCIDYDDTEDKVGTEAVKGMVAQKILY
jgi:hypothetical protein